MNPSSQRTALANYRSRLAQMGMGRFEVLGLNEDRELIRVLAKKLAEQTEAAENLRAMLTRGVSNKVSEKGSLLKVLRASPLVGVDLDAGRASETGRVIDL